jgi:hypothetical protein
VAAKKAWSIASARQHLSEVVGLAAREPQLVYRRAALAAVVVSPALGDQVGQLHRPRLADKLARLRALCAEEGYALPAPERADRAVARSPGGAGRSRRRPR